MVDRDHARRFAVALGLSLLLHAWLMQSHYGKGAARGSEGAAIAVRLISSGSDTRTLVADAVTVPATTPESVVARVSAMDHPPQTISTQVVDESAVAQVMKASTAAPSQPSDPTYYAAGDLDVFPRALVKPDLSAALPRTHEPVAGKVRATLLIDEAGVVNAVRGVEVVAQDMETIVRELLLRTRFTPARNKEGRIVKAQLLVALDYDIRDTREARMGR